MQVLHFLESRGHPPQFGFVTANPPEGVGWGVAEGVVEGVVWGVGGSVGLRVLRRVSLVVSNRGCGRKVLRGCGWLCRGGPAEVWLGAFDRGCRWKMSQEVSPVVSPVSPIGLEFLGVLLVVLDCGCRGRCCVGCCWLCSIADLGVLCWEVAWRVFFVGCDLGCC